MLIRDTLLSDEVGYHLDCAGEAEDITMFDYAVLQLYGKQEIIDELLGTSRNSKLWSWDISAWRSAQVLDAYAAQIASELPASQQRALFAFSLCAEPNRISEISNYVAGTYFEDSLIGGCMLDFKKGNDKKCKHNYEPFKKMRRHLYAPNAIRRAVKQSSYILGKRCFANTLRKLPWPSSVEEGDEVGVWLNEQRDIIRGRREVAMRQFRRYDEGRLPEEHSRVTKPMKGKIEARKKVVRRSTDLAVSVLGGATVSKFVAGKPIEIVGETMILEAIKASSLHKEGHGVLQLAVKSLEGARLAGLCVYFDDTPMLDQLAAFKLNFDCGDEAEVLKTGNLFGITSEGANHPLVLESNKDNKMGRFQELVQPYIDMNEKRNAYYKAVGKFYTEAISIQLWGVDHRKVWMMTCGERPVNARRLAQ